MTWFFEGTGKQLGLSLSPKGCWSANGTCSQSCRPQSGDPGIFKYVEGVQGSWDIHSPDAEEHEYDGLGHGLKAFFDKNEGKAAATIRYYNKYDAKNPALVGASILMPQPAFNDLLALFRTFIGNATLTYVITLEFIGFRPADAETSDVLPSISEFVNPDLLDARPYFSDKVTVNVRAK
jgi:hypothetical protein